MLLQATTEANPIAEFLSQYGLEGYGPAIAVTIVLTHFLKKPLKNHPVGKKFVFWIPWVLAALLAWLNMEFRTYESGIDAFRSWLIQAITDIAGCLLVYNLLFKKLLSKTEENGNDKANLEERG